MTDTVDEVIEWGTKAIDQLSQTDIVIWFNNNPGALLALCIFVFYLGLRSGKSKNQNQLHHHRRY